MIYLYSGTPGSGKSLHMAKRIRDWVKYQDKLVVCNTPINVDEIKGHKRGELRYLDNIDMTPDKLCEISKEYFEVKKYHEGKIKLIIDECQLMFNAREWNISGRADWLKFFTQHRKYGFDIVLVAQFDRMIDRQVRSLIEYEYVHRKIVNYGWKGYLLVLCTLGRKFVCVKIWYPMKERVGSELIYANKKIFKIYDTRETFGN